MDYNNDRDVSIYICIFQIQVDTANVLIKFPCQYFLQWKTSNGKKNIEGTARPTAKNSIVQFNQKLQMNTEMIYDNQQARFYKKETVLNLNLISKSRQDQVKLIGRVNIDLAQIANTNKYSNSRAFKLSYCSVDAQLTFSAALKAKRITNMALIDLDKSSFHDYFSFYSCASRDPRNKKDINMTDYQETSIGYGKVTPENVIDGAHGEHKRGKPFSQTFFMLNSPKYNSNRTSQFPKQIKQNNIQGQKNNFLSDLTIRTPSKSKQVMNSRSTQLTNQIGYANIQLGSKLQEDQKAWERQKINCRQQIDGNRNKIYDLEKKIIELCANLEDSKRHIQMTERKNKQKEQIIRSLRVNEKQMSRKSLDAENSKIQAIQQKDYQHFQETIAKLQRQRQNQRKQWKSQEEIYRSQISQIEASTTRMQKQTQELRRMWNEKKQHYEQKQRGFQVKMKEKENKLSELNEKIDELKKYKYQYEMLKQFNEQKQEQLKNAESNMNKLKLEVQQIHRNNYSEEIYKLKIQLSQATKNYEELLVKYSKNEEQICKYKENYVKIQTAYQIQGKNYESCNQKSLQNESLIYSLQKDNIQLKNSLSISYKANQQLNKKYLQQFGNSSIIQRKIAESQSQLSLLHAQVKRLQGQKEQIILICERLKVEVDNKSKQFEQNIKRIESTIINAQETKDKLYIVEKESLTSKINELLVLKQQHEAQISSLAHELNELQRSSEEERIKKQGILTQLEATISDKQEIIKMYSSEIQNLKQINSQISSSLNDVSEKKKHLQEAVVILEQESQKILYILQQKQVIDKQLEEITIKYQNLMQDFRKKSQQLSIVIIEKQQFQKQNQQKQQRINEQAKIIDEFNEAISQQSQRILSLQTSLVQKTNGYYSIVNQISQTKNELLHSNNAFQICQEELHANVKQCVNLKQIIKEINERYEQHLKLEERYLNQLNLVRQEKEEMQFLMNKNNSRFVDHHEQLEQKIANLQNHIEKYENQIPFLQEEKRQLTQKCLNLQFQLNRINPIHLSIQQNLTKCNLQLQKIRQQNQQKSYLLNLTKGTEQNYVNKIKQLQQSIQRFRLQIQRQSQQRHKIENQLLQNVKSLKVIEEQKINLNEHISQLKQEIVNNQISSKQQLYNQIVQFQDVLQIEAAKSIIQQRNIPLDQLHEHIIENIEFKEQKHQILQTKICNLQAQISFLQQKLLSLENSLQQVTTHNKNMQEELKLRKTQNTYFDYPSFQSQEMAKIVEQQRRQIQRLQDDLKSKTIKGSAALQSRIKQLQTNIVQLQVTFRMEIDRILSCQSNKQQMEGGLSVINQQQSEDQCFRSQRSLNSLIATPNRVKISLDSAQYSELKEKYQKVNEEKAKLQEQLELSEQEKFNLTSALNEKQIELQQGLKGKLVAQLENEQIRMINETMMSNLQSLQIEIESLRNQVSFGTSILLPNQHSVTRSEPNLADKDLQNKDIQIEYLRSELEKLKNRQEQLMWNIKDLEMQLQAVTENLNLLNGSSMNSVLNSSPKLSIEEFSENRDLFQAEKNQPEFGYNKQKLLQNLKKNEQLKEAAHSLIKILRERQKQAYEQQRLIKDLKSNRDMINSALSNLNILKMQMICKNLEPLVKDFQKIKLKVARLQNLRQSSDKREDTLFKVLLCFQEKLKGLKVIAEKDSESISYT